MYVYVRIQKQYKIYGEIVFNDNKERDLGEDKGLNHQTQSHAHAHDHRPALGLVNMAPYLPSLQEDTYRDRIVFDLCVNLPLTSRP